MGRGTYHLCTVPGCLDTHSTRHRFPNPEKDRKRFDAWLQVIQNPNLHKLNPKRVFMNYRVCHQHFTVNDKSSNMFLVRTAVPTQNLPPATGSIALTSSASTSTASASIASESTSTASASIASESTSTVQVMEEELFNPKTNELALTIQELKIISLICDQGSTNRAAVESLVRESREHYLQRNVSPKRCIIIDSYEVIPLYDVPHLIKGTRNNLLNKNLIWVQNKTTTLRATWKDIVAAYKIDDSKDELREIKMLGRIKPHHIFPSQQNKMKVAYATQVLSNSMAVAIFSMGKNNEQHPNDIQYKLDANSIGTARICKFFDTLFKGTRFEADKTYSVLETSNNGVTEYVFCQRGLFKTNRTSVFKEFSSNSARI